MLLLDKHFKFDTTMGTWEGVSAITRLSKNGWGGEKQWERYSLIAFDERVTF